MILFCTLVLGEQTYIHFENFLTIFDCAKNDDNDEFEPAMMKI